MNKICKNCEHAGLIYDGETRCLNGKIDRLGEIADFAYCSEFEEREEQAE